MASYPLRRPLIPSLENLRNDSKYITSWLSAGWSAYRHFVNIYLCLPCGTLSQRRNDFREPVSSRLSGQGLIIFSGKLNLSSPDYGAHSDHP